ncbi:hypothetical protein QBC35DRAFT_416198 [Podospora australis]|uniref:Alpha/beta hydrolase fold-3 domain-containing protein n=1 Tax=Podospora australis TaxID=1536484 RepID=A0AAN7AG99_9PEZI|nr:hypothetical protein QBC35DRAFT_416198 [Podospora australis]
MGVAGLDGKTIASPTTKTVRKLPIYYRLFYTFASVLVQCVVLPTVSRLFGALNKNSKKSPDLVKSYPSLKGLKIRIFYPPTHSPSSSSDAPKFPTLLTIHGGGFVLGSPRDNDLWNRTFSTTHNFLVIALDYPKAPGSPYPTAIHSLESLTHLILSDSSLPIDKSRLALAGWSAGGNLSLSLSQLPSIRPLISAVIPIYPVVDFATATSLKLSTRRYKPSLGGFRARGRDFLLPMMGWFNWAYLYPGTSCHEPLLSPIYARREDLPKNIFMIACEMDLLAAESWRMISKLAGKRVPLPEEAVGKQDPGKKGELITHHDERFTWEVKNEEEGMRYKWLLVPDAVHGYDQDSIGTIMRGDKEGMEDAVIKTEKVARMVGEWLLEGPLKEQRTD